MPYLILLMLGALLFGVSLHLRNQFRKTAHIRRDLHEARANRVLTGLHALRNEE